MPGCPAPGADTRTRIASLVFLQWSDDGAGVGVSLQHAMTAYLRGHARSTRAPAWRLAHASRLGYERWPHLDTAAAVCIVESNAHRHSDHLPAASARHRSPVLDRHARRAAALTMAAHAATIVGVRRWLSIVAVAVVVAGVAAWFWAPVVAGVSCSAQGCPDARVPLASPACRDPQSARTSGWSGSGPGATLSYWIARQTDSHAPSVIPPAGQSVCAT
jgi:hypothetical protein